VVEVVGAAYRRDNMGKWDDVFIDPTPDVWINGINESLGHFIIFPDEAGARAFAAEVPQPNRSEITPPEPGDPEDTQWSVTVFGPWRGQKQGRQILKALATRLGGEYDGTEDVHPEWRAAEREAFGR
jgi:hypothetical protein